MPHSPRRPCRMNGCPNLAEPGEQYCSEHRKQAEQFYNKYQRPTDRKKYGRAWKRMWPMWGSISFRCRTAARLTGVILSRSAVHVIRSVTLSWARDCLTRLPGRGGQNLC